MVAAPGLDASGGVFTAAQPSHAGVLGGMAVSRWAAADVEELNAPGFDNRVVCLQLQPLDVSIWANGRLVADGLLARGSFQAHAPGDTFRAVARRGYDLLRFVIPEPVLGDVVTELELGESAAGLELLEASTSADPFLLALGVEITRALASDAPVWKLHADRLAAGFLTQILARHSNVVGSGALKRALTRGCLAPWQVKRATDHVMAHLDEDFSLADLASSARLSPFHFARAFKRSTGLSPQRFVMERRIERAKELLTRTEQGLAQVALACGFASQSHFTTAFKRHMGISPGRWREMTVN